MHTLPATSTCGVDSSSLFFAILLRGTKTSEFGNISSINSRHCRRRRFHRVGFFHRGGLLNALAATVKLCCPVTRFLLRNLTELLCITWSAHEKCARCILDARTRGNLRCVGDWGQSRLLATPADERRRRLASELPRLATTGYM